MHTASGKGRDFSLFTQATQTLLAMPSALPAGAQATNQTISVIAAPSGHHAQ